MDNLDKYISYYHGMELQPCAEQDKRFNENGILFLAYYLILKQIDGSLNSNDVECLKQIIMNIRTFAADGSRFEGLFDRGHGESKWENKDSIREISHDNLTAISCISYIYQELEYYHTIADHGKKNWWKFDNVYPEKPRLGRIMHPRDIIFWSYLHGSFWAKLFIWEPMLEAIMSCFSKYDSRPIWFTRIWYTLTFEPYEKRTFISTSGKLLSFIRLYALRKTWFGKLTWKMCNYFINKNFEKGWEEVFSIYFQNQEHPINILVKKIYDKNKEIF